MLPLGSRVAFFKASGEGVLDLAMRMEGLFRTLLAALVPWLVVPTFLAGCGGGCDCEQPDVELASLEIVDGSGQTGPVAQSLTKALVVRLLTSSGTPATGQTVSFAVAGGGGSVSADSVAADTNGYARTQWTLGTVAGPQRIELRSVGRDGTPIVWGSMDATATHGPPAVLTVAAGDGQSAEQMQPLANPIGARVTDRYGNPCEGVTVAFAAGSGGSAATSTATSDTEGMAGTQWTLGLPIGQQTLEASIPGLSSVSFAATATRAPSGAPVAISKVAGDQQSMPQHTMIPQELQIRVSDQLGNGVPGVPVVFSGGAGTSYFPAKTIVTDGEGIAKWAGYLHDAGEQMVNATVPGLGNASFKVAVAASGGRFDGVYTLKALCDLWPPVTAATFDHLLIRDNTWSDPNDVGGIFGHPWSGTVQPADGATGFGYAHTRLFPWSFAGVMSFDASGRAVGSGTYHAFPCGSDSNNRGTWSAERQ